MKKTRSEIIKQTAKEVNRETLDKFHNETKFRKADVEMIILLAVAKGYEAGLDEK